MDPLLINAASGMKARMESLDMLANNVANSGTAGFKADREFYTLFQSVSESDELPLIDKRWTDFSQGTILATGNPLDLALDGKGFFALNSPAGTVYSRNGSFQISSQNQLATTDGYTLRNTRANGQPIAVDPLRPVDIDRTGVVRQSGQEVGQIELAGFKNATEALSKLGTSYFAQTGDPQAAGAAPDAVVRQGASEQSNGPVTDGAVRLVSIMRQFEMLQHAMSIGAEMNKRATDEIARAN